MYQVPAREEMGKVARADNSPSPPQPSSVSGRRASSIQCCSCNFEIPFQIPEQFVDLDVATVEIMEGVRFIIGDTMEGARLPCFQLLLKMAKGGPTHLVRPTGHQTGKSFQALSVGQTRKSFKAAPLIFSKDATMKGPNIQLWPSQLRQEIEKSSATNAGLHLVSIHGMLGVGDPSGGLVDTRVMKSDRSTLLPQTDRSMPVAAREGRSMLGWECLRWQYFCCQLVFVEVNLTHSEHHLSRIFPIFLLIGLL